MEEQKGQSTKKDKNQQTYSTLNHPYLMPHEFLFLITNCVKRLPTIEKMHKPVRTSQLGHIYQWELGAGKPIK